MDTQPNPAVQQPAQASEPPQENSSKQWKPTAFERRVEARLAEKQPDPAELTDAEQSPAGESSVQPGPLPAESSVSKALRLFQEAGLQDDPEALRLVSELVAVALRQELPAAFPAGSPSKSKPHHPALGRRAAAGAGSRAPSTKSAWAACALGTWPVCWT